MPEVIVVEVLDELVYVPEEKLVVVTGPTVNNEEALTVTVGVVRVMDVAAANVCVCV